MTTQKIYSCNLCDMPIDPAALPGTGIIFGARNSIRFSTLAEAENHICNACLDALAAARSAVRDLAPKPEFVPAADHPVFAAKPHGEGSGHSDPKILTQDGEERGK